MLSSDVQLGNFQSYILNWYGVYGRKNLPWRHTRDPYHILVSEMMLQQTQVDRVIPKFESFLGKFHTVTDLAQSSLSDVLTSWQGLGYNRRAKFLHLAALAVTNNHNAIFPTTTADLQKLPGIGPYTASAIMAFAYDKPATMIETNIRTVFLYHFFPNELAVHDTELLPLIERSVPSDQPGTWYQALMDYGSQLKKLVGNPSRKSSAYTKQSTFLGSKRQVRGAILRVLSDHVHRSEKSLIDEVELDIGMSINTSTFAQILTDLIQEKLITKIGTLYSL